eukprot:60677_1
MSWLWWILKVLFFDSEYKCSDNAIQIMDKLCNKLNCKGYMGIVIIDGICNLCNSFIQFAHKYDNKNVIYVGWVQNENVVHPLLQSLNIKPFSIFTKFAFIEYDQKTKEIIVHRASTASFNIIKHLSFPVNLLYIGIFVPIFIRNFLYHIIATFRYELFGQTVDCQNPSSSLQKK